MTDFQKENFNAYTTKVLTTLEGLEEVQPISNMFTIFGMLQAHVLQFGHSLLHPDEGVDLIGFLLAVVTDMMAILISIRIVTPPQPTVQGGTFIN